MAKYLAQKLGGNWKVNSVAPPHTRRDFAFFTAKDAARAREADVGLMFWDGESSGTVVNAARLVAARKPVVIYIAPERKFLTVRSQADLDSLLSPCPVEIRQRLNRYVADYANTQPAMF